jgi:RNA polymerase sigma-70 factor, ECF subfamily
MMVAIEVRTEAVRAVPTPRRPARGGERRLIKEAQEGSSRAFEELFRRYWRRAHRAAFLIVHDRAAAEDIAQEAFLAAVRTLDRFDRRRPFGPWLHRIVVNRAIDWARARALRRETGNELLDERADPMSEELAVAEEPGELLVALWALSPERRAVVVLRYLLDYTPGEIARVLEIPRGTVNSRLRRGLDTLAAALGEEER